MPVGTLTVYLDSKDIPGFNKLILPEEVSLINYISERLGRVMQRINFSEELEITKSKLEIQNTLLESKNNALSEILNHLNSKMEKKEEELTTNIVTIILPLIEKIRDKHNPEQYLDILTETIKDMSSPFPNKLKNNSTILLSKKLKFAIS
jgi:hypothetical protein